MGVAVQLTNISAGCNYSQEKPQKSGCVTDNILAGCNYSQEKPRKSGCVTDNISAGCNFHLGRVAVQLTTFWQVVITASDEWLCN